MSQNGHNLAAPWILEAHARFEGPLLRYALRLTHDQQTAQEVVQDTFLRLCREPPQGRDGQLAEWLYTVCRNRAIDIKRKEQRMTPAATLTFEHITSREPVPDQAAEARDDATRILQSLETLSETQQEIVRMRFEGGLSYRQMGQVLGLSESHIGVLLHQALKSLRTRLNPHPA